MLKWLVVWLHVYIEISQTKHMGLLGAGSRCSKNNFVGMNENWRLVYSPRISRAMCWIAETSLKIWKVPKTRLKEPRTSGAARSLCVGSPAWTRRLLVCEAGGVSGELTAEAGIIFYQRELGVKVWWICTPRAAAGLSLLNGSSVFRDSETGFCQWVGPVHNFQTRGIDLAVTVDLFSAAVNSGIWMFNMPVWVR